MGREYESRLEEILVDFLEDYDIYETLVSVVKTVSKRQQWWFTDRFSQSVCWHGSERSCNFL